MILSIIQTNERERGYAYIQKGIDLNTFRKRVRRNENIKALFDRYVIYSLFLNKPQVFPWCNVISQ